MNCEPQNPCLPVSQNWKRLKWHMKVHTPMHHPNCLLTAASTSLNFTALRTSAEGTQERRCGLRRGTLNDHPCRDASWAVLELGLYSQYGNEVPAVT